MSSLNPSTPSTSTSSSSTEATLIADAACGISILAAPQSKPVFDRLAVQAKTNYWAQQVVHDIQALCAGKMHLNNVFVKKQDIANNNSEFYVVLPGCTAILAKTATGECHLLNLQVDENYFLLQEEHKKPGLHAVTKRGTGWKTKFHANNNITITPYRFVAILDRHANDIHQALDAAWPSFSDNPLTTSHDLASSTGFDAHYTPGTARIGGLKNIHQALHANTDPELHESAILLAQTMKEARDIKGVLWVSERGGSGVLAQALQILVDQDIKLHKTHSIFLCNPTTRQSTIQELSLKLGVRQPRRIARNNALQVNELVGGLGFGGGYTTAYIRLKQDENYTGLQFVGDVFRESTSPDSAYGVITTILLVAVFAAAAASLVAADAIFSAVFFVIIAASLLGKLGKAFFEAYFPRLYQKIIDTF